MSFLHIAGHQRPLRVLRKIVSSGRVPHAQLYWGPDGIGKELVARALARVLFCVDPEAFVRAEACGKCASCAKIEADAHPDLHVLAAQKSTIGVADVRQLQETLSYQAFERGRKVAIIRDAFRMTREAANALLKTLEEPPDGVYLILLAHHRNQLLPTLVSRCQSLRFDPLPSAMVEELLLERGTEPAGAATLAALSGGCPGTVLGGAPEELLGADREAAEVIADWAGFGVTERFALASRWASEKDRLEARLDSLERHLRQRSRQQTKGIPDPLDTLTGLMRVRELMDRNVNAQLALDALFACMLGEEWEENT